MLLLGLGAMSTCLFISQLLKQNHLQTLLTYKFEEFSVIYFFKSLCHQSFSRTFVLQSWVASQPKWPMSFNEWAATYDDACRLDRI